MTCASKNQTTTASSRVSESLRDFLGTTFHNLFKTSRDPLLTTSLATCSNVFLWTSSRDVLRAAALKSASRDLSRPRLMTPFANFFHEVSRLLLSNNLFLQDVKCQELFSGPPLMTFFHKVSSWDILLSPYLMNSSQDPSWPSGPPVATSFQTSCQDLLSRPPLASSFANFRARIPWDLLKTSFHNFFGEILQDLSTSWMSSNYLLLRPRVMTSVRISSHGLFSQPCSSELLSRDVFWDPP